MSFRSSQEDKFRNIVLNMEPSKGHSPDLHSSNPIKPTNSPTNSNSPNKPSTPINFHKFLGKEVPIVKSQIQTRPYFQSNSQEVLNESQGKNMDMMENSRNHASAIISTSHQLENQQALIYRLQSEIREKEEIINQLKSIIRISSQNTTKSKLRSSFTGRDRSPEKKIEEMEKQIKELKHNVKILTIENNSLSDYIDRLKQTIGSKQIQHFDIDRQERETKDNLHRIENMEAHYKGEVSKLKKVIHQQQVEYESKIDEFIASHKSLAHQCKLMEQEKAKLYSENQRLSIQLKEVDQNYKRLHGSLQEKMKNSTFEKFSIQKIKEQYAESLKQVKATVTFETQHIFDQFKSKFELASKKIQLMEQQIRHIEETIHLSRSKEQKMSPPTKKSAIYIEEGMESSQNSSNSKRLKTSRERGFITSRVYEEGSDSRVTNQATRPLRDEIIRLKDIVNELENQISQRSDYYTFRERQYEDSNAQLSSERLKVTLREEQIFKLKKEKEVREKQLFQEIERRKLELNKAENVFKREKSALNQSYIAQIQKKDLLISELRSELQTLKLRYEHSTSQISRLSSSARFQVQLQRDNARLKEELQECIRKIEQYKKLFTILKEESDENTSYERMLEEMKSQVYLVRQKYHNDLSRLSCLEKEKESLMIFNQEIKMKLEESIEKTNQILFDEQRYKENIRSLENQRAELNNQVTYLKSTIRNLEDDLKMKIDNEMELIEEKKKLEQQIVGYLSLARKMSTEEPRELTKSRCIHEQFGLEELLSKITKLQNSMTEQKTTKREKREKMAKVLSETLAEASFFENRRL